MWVQSSTPPILQEGVPKNCKTEAFRKQFAISPNFAHLWRFPNPTNVRATDNSPLAERQHAAWGMTRPAVGQQKRSGLKMFMPEPRNERLSTSRPSQQTCSDAAAAGVNKTEAKGRLFVSRGTCMLMSRHHKLWFASAVASLLLGSVSQAEILGKRRMPCGPLWRSVAIKGKQFVRVRDERFVSAVGFWLTKVRAPHGASLLFPFQVQRGQRKQAREPYLSTD